MLGATLYACLWERACSGRRTDEKRQGTAFIQDANVIVDVHREQARSHIHTHK